MYCKWELGCVKKLFNDLTDALHRFAHIIAKSDAKDFHVLFTQL